MIDLDRDFCSFSTGVGVGVSRFGVDSLDEGVELRLGRLKSPEFFKLPIGGLGGALLGDLVTDDGFGGGAGLSPVKSPGFLGGGRGLYFFEFPLAPPTLDESWVVGALLASPIIRCRSADLRRLLGGVLGSFFVTGISSDPESSMSLGTELARSSRLLLLVPSSVELPPAVLDAFDALLNLTSRKAGG